MHQVNILNVFNSTVDRLTKKIKSFKEEHSRFKENTTGQQEVPQQQAKAKVLQKKQQVKHKNSNQGGIKK